MPIENMANRDMAVKTIANRRGCQNMANRNMAI